MNELGNLIKKKRKEKQLSCKKLGELCGVSDSLISNIENNKTMQTSWITLCKIAKELSLSPIEILITAGYLSVQDIAPNLKLYNIDKLSEEDFNLVQSYIDFLISRKKENQNDI